MAAAGSGKTRNLIAGALERPDQLALIVTYTNENLSQIKKGIVDRCGVIPRHIRTQTWYPFLLQHGARPYQHFFYDQKRIASIFFPTDQAAFSLSRRFVRKENVEEYYIVGKDQIVGDVAADFVVGCNTASGGLVIDRLERIFDAIYIDEVQDLAGYDLEILKLLFEADINIEAVGDNRQAIYQTNYSQKNRQYRDTNIYRFFSELQESGICELRNNTDCYRCNQAICDFADKLYPEMPTTRSRNVIETDHDGVFFIPERDVPQYIERFRPQVLQYQKSAKTIELLPMNFGQSKGSSFDRVLIFPTTRIAEYLRTGIVVNAGNIAKLYVAVTRARHSVAFVYEGKLFSGFAE